MYKVFAFQRLNKIGVEERQEIILGEGYKFFQAYHDCLYCYDSLENVKYPHDPIYTIDDKGAFVLVNVPSTCDKCGDLCTDEEKSKCPKLY